ncbi:MAG: hypothetical protein M1832_005546 [Thelocarpon impressellum]|nr:MAG: hypothetical protein M1832_005546 [Thelocarpon impressellum]
MVRLEELPDGLPKAPIGPHPLPPRVPSPTSLARTPLFMNSLSDAAATTDNASLEALRALAHEGTPYEVASNFRTQGNEAHRGRQYGDAVQFYTRGLAALAPPSSSSPSSPDGELYRTLLLNRAASNLALQNYGHVITDTAPLLALDRTHPKAAFRAASAHLALARPEEALSILSAASTAHPDAEELLALSTRALALQSSQRELKAREAHALAVVQALSTAFSRRQIPTRTSASPPSLESASPSLASALDPSSALSIPVLLLYPLAAESDLLKAVAVDEDTLGRHLEYILPPPWDEKGEYTPGGVGCYAETTTGGLLKVGTKVAIAEVFRQAGGKLEVLDGLVKVFVVPRASSASWISTFKERATRHAR